MCWNARASFLSFAAGLLVCVVTSAVVAATPVRLLCAFCAFLLLVQLAEGLTWTDQACGGLNRLSTRATLALTALQPAALFVLFVGWQGDRLSKLAIGAASLVLLTYLGFLLVTLTWQPAPPECTQPLPNCEHLPQGWWQGSAAAVYLAAAFAMLLLVVRPLPLAVFTALCFGGTFLWSMLLYKCGAPSLWCWLVVALPPVFATFHNLSGAA